jgi:hypothetical protein
MDDYLEIYKSNVIKRNLADSCINKEQELDHVCYCVEIITEFNKLGITVGSNIDVF